MMNQICLGMKGTRRLVIKAKINQISELMLQKIQCRWLCDPQIIAGQDSDRSLLVRYKRSRQNHHPDGQPAALILG